MKRKSVECPAMTDDERRVFESIKTAWRELDQLEPLIRQVQQAGAALFHVAEAGAASGGTVDADAIFHFAEFLEDHAERMNAQLARCINAVSSSTDGESREELAR
jgi:hypothetical protein